MWCKIFGHKMCFDSMDVAGPSTCKRCGHKEPGITWDRGGSLDGEIARTEQKIAHHNKWLKRAWGLFFFLGAISLYLDWL